jgi:putative photosynthetic complex assembly protein 2
MLIALAVACALGLWWLGTALVLNRVRRPHAGHFRARLIACAIAAVALAGMFVSAQATSVAGAFAAFACAIVLWGANEFAFLTGACTGPRKQGCPPGCHGLAHAGHAIAAIFHHEVALIVSGIAVAAVTWGEPNPVALWTFLVLWIMRASAKLNLHLGVVNSGEEFLPEQLRYLASFFRRRAMNVLFPVSVLLSAAGAVWLAAGALDPATPPGRSAGLMLVTTLLALGTLEHLFLMLPVPTTALWRVALPEDNRT